MPAAVVELQRSRGDLRLRLKLRDGSTTLGELYQQGCLKARLPGIAPVDPLEGVLVNTAGGLTDGDKLKTTIEWGAKTRGIVTTQAAERIYHCRQAPALISTNLTVGDMATACWLPQETILFDQSRLERRTSAELGKASRLFAVETLIFGRTAMGEELRCGHLFDQFRIYQDGRLTFADALQLRHAAAATIHAQLQRRGVLNAARCSATLVFAGNTDNKLLPKLRSAIEDSSATGGASDLGNIIVMRLIANDSKSMRELILTIYRHCLGNRGFTDPRVWHC